MRIHTGRPKTEKCAWCGAEISRRAICWRIRSAVIVQRCVPFVKDAYTTDETEIPGDVVYTVCGSCAHSELGVATAKNTIRVRVNSRQAGGIVHEVSLGPPRYREDSYGD